MGPWTFDEATAWSREASIAQEAVENGVRDAAREFAEAEESYRKALAVKIVYLHEEGVAWSTCGDLARGNEQVAAFKRERDIAEGLYEAARQAAWRRSADRRDTERFIEWSMRRELAEGARC